jgi:hypothetical protein
MDIGWRRRSRIQELGRLFLKGAAGFFPLAEMRRDPGQLPHQRMEFSRVDLFSPKTRGQLDIMVSAQEFAVAPDANAEARLRRLDLSARRAQPDGHGFEFGIDHILRGCFAVVGESKNFARVQLEFAIDALMIVLHLAQGGDFSNRRFQFFRLFLDRVKAFE